MLLPRKTPPKLLSIAGSDSGGGAGIQADIKTATLLGCHAMTAITAVTVQDTQAVKDIHPIPATTVYAQAKTVMEDIGVDAIKTGMLHNQEIIQHIAKLASEYPNTPFIIDPVMISTSGHPLLAPSAIETLKQQLLSHASLLTPNLPEAEALTGLTIREIPDMHQAGQALLAQGCQAVLIKGGHGTEEQITDLLITPNTQQLFHHPRLPIMDTHGSGCTLSTAIACFLAKGKSLDVAVKEATDFVHHAIASSTKLGRGSQPLNLLAS